MTIDEAIKHTEEVAEEKENEGKLLCQSEGASIGCLTCAEEHRQLAEWLKDYKRLLKQEPKTGHWIIIDDCEKFIAKCSECGQIEDSRMIGKYAYCHCGARMVEPQESEDKECTKKI